MNKKGELEVRDFGALFLIYILLITTIASSANISIIDNPNPLTSKKEIILEEPQSLPQQNQTNPISQKEESPPQQNQTQQYFQNITIPQNQTQQYFQNITIPQNQTQQNLQNITIPQNQTTKNQTQQYFQNITIPQNQTKSPTKNSTNRTELSNRSLIISSTIPSNQSEPKTELIQHKAKIGQKVKWTKRVYTTNKEYKIQIPKNANKIPKQHSFSINSNKPKDYIEIEYETEAPKTEETKTPLGKQVKVYSNEHYTNITTYTNLSETLNIKDKTKIKIIWQEENQEIHPIIKDTNKNGIYDYIEWTTPHLSNQTFQIIIITSSSHLSQNKTFLSDIYNEVYALDQIYSPTILQNEYVRMTFEKNLTQENDITIYPKIIEGNPKVEVYEKNSTVLLATFENIVEGKNQIYLTNLSKPQDTFDLKIINGSLQFDQIIDPTGTLESLGETGEINVTDSLVWTWRAFSETYSTVPVILATPATYTNCPGTCSGTTAGNGGMYPIPLVKDVSTTGFNFSMCIDGGAVTCTTGASQETFHYFVFNPAATANYDWIETGTTSSVPTDGTDTPTTLSSSFANTPDIWTQAQTYSQNGEIGAQAWVEDNLKSTTAFTYIGCVHTGIGDNCDTNNPPETFGYVAIDTSQANFSSNVNFQFGMADISNSAWTAATFSPTYTAPRVMVTQNDDDGGQDPQYVWAGDVSGATMKFRYCEEDAGDVCNTHTSEKTYWFSMEEGLISVGEDTQPPYTTILTPQNIIYNTQSFNFNISLDELGQAWFNLDNTSNITMQTTNNLNFNYTNNSVPEGSHTFYAYANDTQGNNNFTQIINFIIDTISPIITFQSPTPSSGSSQGLNNFTVNTTIQETNFQNITYSLYNSTSLVNQTTYLTPINLITFQNLPTSTYYYNVTVTDKVGQITSTPTRNLYIDSENPLIEFSGITKPTGEVISGNQISYEVTATEANEKNITFTLVGPDLRENTYTDFRRSITWTLLPDGFYEYNVTIFDTYNHTNKTETRNITLDNSAPQPIFKSPTESNNAYKSQNWIVINSSVLEDNFQNITFYLYNTSQLINQTTFTDNTRNINFTNLPNTKYFYNITATDKAGNKNSTETRAITLDTIQPIVNFELPTEANNNNLSQNWIFINSSIQETNFQNITFSLYDTSVLVNQTTFTDNTRNINFTNLASKIYSYNITLIDKAGNQGNTLTRKTGLDLQGPTINILTPQSKVYGTGINLLLNVTISDPIAGVSSCWWNIDNGVNKSITCNTPVNFNTTDGIHEIKFFSNDTFDNIGQSQITFSVSTQGPAIELIKPANNTFYSLATLTLFNYSTTDPDGVESCSLFGSWGSGWHLNQTDSSYGLLLNKTTRTCTSTWGSDCTVENNLESDNTFDGCENNQNTDERVAGMWLSSTKTTAGSTVNIICQYETWATDDLYIWYYNGTGWKTLQQSLDVTSSGMVNKSASFTVDNVIGTHQIRCGITYGQVTETDFCADLGIYNDNDDLNFTVVAPKEEGNFTVNLSTEGNYKWNIKCNDSQNYTSTALNNFTIAVDLTPPIIDFGAGTLSNNSRTSQNKIYVNTTIQELNLENLTFFLYNSTGSQIQNSTIYDNSTSLTWTSLEDGTYYYNVTATDKASRYSSTPTRKIEIDTTAPTGANTGPVHNSYTNLMTQNFTATMQDLVELKATTLFIYNSTGGLVYSYLISLTGLTSTTIGKVYTFLYDDIFSWFYQIKDSVNNEYNTTSSTINIDQTVPEITFISPTKSNNTIVLQDWITLNTSVYEANYKNITFSLYDSTGLKFQNSYTDTTRQINWTLLLDDTYHYNVTVFDKAQNNATSETRSIILDTTAPVLIFSGTTKPNNSVITGSSISLEVYVAEANEQNITFFLYNATGYQIRENTFLDGRRTATWTLLSEGMYYYNVTVADRVNQIGSTLTRKITLDNTAPTLNFITPTENNNANKSQNYIFINSSLTEPNKANITFYLYNQTSQVAFQTYTDETLFHNFTNLPDGIYFYNITAIDEAGNAASTSTRTINLDTIAPLTTFVSPTEPNATIRNRDWIFINTTTIEQNFKQITFNIYDSAGLVSTQIFTNNTSEHNFTNLPDENYKYNVTTSDWAGNSDSTETRYIGLDGAGPIIDIIKPRAKTYGYNESLPLEHTVSDKVSLVDSCWWNIDNGPNQSIACNTPTTFNTTVATHTLYFFANDTFGNIGSDSVSFFISITGPAIELVNPLNDTFLGTATTLNFSFAANDPDGTDSCSLYGDWNGGWHKNETYSGGWQEIGFRKRKDIIITNTGTTTLSDFPLYIKLSSTYTDSGDYTDLKFFNGTCAQNQTTQLAHEVESYNSSEATIWVRIPELPTSGQTVCLYYANDNAQDTENKTGTWNSDYAIVYHMDSLGKDSTSNNRDKPANIGIPSSDNTFLGEGVSFSDGNAWNLANLAYWEAGYSTRSHEAVFKTSSDITTRQVLFAEGGGTNGIMMYIVSENLYARWWSESTGWSGGHINTTISPNTKYYAVMTYSNPGNYQLYLNGVLINSVITTTAISAHSGDGGIGYTGTNTKDFHDITNSGGHYFLGSIYEFRARDIIPTSDQINQTYQTIFNPSNTLSYQPEENFTAFQILFSEEGKYNWNIECNDTIGYNSTAQNNFSFTVDITSPQVFFGLNTENNNSNVNKDWVFVDANLIENNFKNITFNLYNSTQLLQAQSFADNTREYNFTNLASGTYYYNIIVFDLANHIGISQTRKINLDLIAPTGELNTPSNYSFLNSLTQNLTATFSDATGLLNATLYILNETGQIIYTQVVELGGTLSETVGIVYDFLQEGIFSWFYSIEDVVGNKANTTSNTLTIDTTNPLIEYTLGTEESNKIFERENIFVNVTSSDNYWKNITFNLYDSNSKVFSNTFSDGTKQINWTFLPDETYFYNVTAYDLAGNFNSTSTRNITLDNLYPTIAFSGSTKPDGVIVSGDRISISVSVTEANEANITFYLFNETGFNIKTNIYTNPQRGLSWNLIPEGTYYYNVTVVDRLSHSASTLTRLITLDNTAPQITYGFGTLSNNTYINQDWIFSKAIITEDNFQNITFSLYNSSGTVQQSTFPDTTRQINFTNLLNGNYWYDMTSCDKASNCNTSQTRYITLDSISPTIDFASPTEIDNFNKTQNWIFINSSIQETNFQNITFFLYDTSGLVNQTTFTDSTRKINFTSLNSKTYQYNATTTDKAGNTASTQTRKIGIDYLGPSIQILTPQAKAYGYNISLPLTYTVSDNIVGSDKCWYNIDNQVNSTIGCTSSATFNTSNGEHTLHFFSNDTLSNIAYKNVTFLVSTTGPAIQLMQPTDNSFYSKETQVFFNYTAEDPDLTQTCSLWGTWNGGWHLNQTDFEMETYKNGSVFEDFESGEGGFIHGQYSGGIDQWHRSSESTYDGSFAFKLGDIGAGNYSNNVGAYLQTPVYTIYENTTFSFRHYLETEARYDGAKLEYMLDENGTWIKVTNFISGGYTNTKNGADYGFVNGEDIWTTLIGSSSNFQLTEPNLTGITQDNITFRFLFASDSSQNAEGWYIDAINFTSMLATERGFGNFSLNLSEEGTSEWNIQCNDSRGYYTWAVSNYSITFDVTNPIITFGTNTLQDDSNVSQNFIYINSSIIENNFKNMTFYLYNQTNLIATHSQNDTSRDYTFTNLNNGRYYYNITVFDSASRSNSTQTRTILLDTVSPTGNPNSPSNNLITNNPIQNLTTTLSDENGLTQAVLYIFNQSGLVYSQIIPLANELSITLGTIYNFLTDGVYQWFYQTEDIVGNKYNITNSTIIIDTTSPQINFIQTTLPNNTYISQDNIYFNTSITEANFQNITFALYNKDNLVGAYTFTNSKRDINYTLLSDDQYFYNVTSSDKAGNTNTSETRIITLDNIPPTANYISPTKPDTANVSQNFIFLNTSITEANLANITFKLYLESTLINITTYQSKTESINFTNLADGNYFYNVTITDKAGLSSNLPTKKITLDTTSPILFFISPTENSGVSLEQETITLNTFLTETNFQNITFYLYNETTLLNKTTYQTPITQIEFSAQGTNSTYFYNATVFDTAGNSDSTSTRNITLIDTTFPTLTLTSPQNKTYTYNESIRINYDVYDLHLDTCWYNLNSGKNITMPNCQSVTISVADEKSHTLKVYANDTLGYTVSENVTFFTNTSLIKFPETYSVQSGSVFTDGTSIESINEINPTKGFILHTVRAGESLPSTLQVTSDFTKPEEIVFKNYDIGAGAIVDWSLIAGPNITTQRGEISYKNENTLSLSITQVNLSNSFIIINNRLNSTISSENIDGFWTAKFTDNSSVNFTRYSTLAEGVLSYQIVSWQGVSVQSGNAQISDTSITIEDTLSQINPNKTFMIFSKKSDNTQIQNSMLKGKIKNSTTLNFTREGSAGTLDIEWFTITSPILNSQHGTYTHLETSLEQYIPMQKSLINISRAFNIQSNKNSGSSTLFERAFVTQSIYNKTSLVLQKGATNGAGTSAWSTIEITELDAPEITLTYPINTQNFSTYNILSFNFTISDESKILNCSLYGNWSGSWHLNQTILSPTKDITLSFSNITVESDNYYAWNVECTDAYQNKAFSSSNFTFAAFLAPTKPIIYNITQTSNDGLGNITLFWNNSNHSAIYKIYTGPTIQAMSYLAETTNQNYTDSNFAGQKRRFYQIKAINPTGENSSGIFSAHLYELKHNLIKSKNWIAFPSNFTNIETANKTIAEIPQSTAFTTFNATTQSRITCNKFSCPETVSCTPTNCNFKIKPGKAYEININTSLSQEVNWSAVGRVYEAQVINLTKNTTSFGKNWISISANTTLSNAQGLIGSISNADAISRWNSMTQSSQGLIPSPFPWIPGFIGNNFQLNLEEGYEVSVTASTQWTQN